MLEQAVINNDIEGVKKLLQEEAPIEFTAKAVGLACRFIGSQMVEALLDGGATLSYELTPTLKRKYNCRIEINNSDDLKIDYSLYLFRNYTVENYDLEIISDDERQQVLRVLFDRNEGRMDEIMFYAILFDDELMLDTLNELGINEISDYRTDIVAGRVPINRLDSYGRYYKREFQNAIKEAEDDALLKMLKSYLSYMKVEQIDFFPADYFAPDFTKRPIEDKFVSRFCSNVLFDFFVAKTNMVQKVKKWDLLYALVDQNNAEGMQFALSENWIIKSKDISLLLAYAKKKKAKTDLIGSLLDKQNNSNNKEKKTKSVLYDLSLDDKPLSVTEMKKIWGYKKQEDGTLIITSYKGDDKNVTIPTIIGKDTVTAIAPGTFNPKASGITEAQRIARKDIASVEFPGTIKKIPSDMFCYGHISYDFDEKGTPHFNLKQIILNAGIEVIGKCAFKYCNGIESIEIPNSVKKIEAYAFQGCRKLKSVKLPAELTQISAGLFAGCKLLKTVNIPEGVEIINRDAFAECAFSEMIIPNSVKKIEWGAFWCCKKLRSITIPNHVVFEEDVFAGCKLLANENGQIVINGVLFGILIKNIEELSVKEAITPLAIGNDVKSIAVCCEKLPIIVYKECSDKGYVINVDGLNVGDEICFGRFPNEKDCTMKPLKWRVLDIVDGSALLVTVDCIMSHYYGTVQTNTWKNASVRKLLNEGFYNVAFSDEEKSQIVLSKISNPKNRFSNVDGGPSTEDYVFLLSYDEVELYMPTENSRKAMITDYADNPNVIKYDGKIWRTRTPGKKGYGSLAIDKEGELTSGLGDATEESYIRPAIWIKQKEN